MVEFISVTLEGVGSIIDRITYPLNRVGLTILTGENGAGKTTIFNGISWVVYGQLLKKGSSLEPWEHVRGKDYKGMHGTVYLSIDGIQYHITRTDKALNLFIEGHKSPIKGKVLIQQEIIRLVGYSFDLFKSTILFGQELKRFMGEDGPTKKKILEETFNTQFINLARETVQKRLSPLLEEYTKLDAHETAQLSILNNLNELIKQAKKEKVEFQKKKERKIAEYQDEIDELKKEFKDIGKDYEPLILGAKKEKRGLEEKIDNSLVEKEFKADFSLKGQTDILDKLRTEAQNIKDTMTRGEDVTCDKCGQSLKGDFLRSDYRRLKTQIFNKETEVNRIKKDYDKIQESLNGQKEKVKRIDELKTKIRGYEIEQEKQKRILGNNEIIKRSIDALKDKIENQNNLKLNIKIKPLRAKFNKAKETLENTASDKLEVKKKVDLNKWLLDDPLSNTGLKSFIFESMIKKINAQLKKYIHLVGFEIQLYIDLSTHRKDLQIAIVQDGHAIPYEDLSGGQKQLADIALIFANNDVTTTNKPVNVMFFDEVFERLSTKSIDVVSNIIQTKATHRSIHLVTHLSSFRPTNAKIIHFELSSKKRTQISL